MTSRVVILGNDAQICARPASPIQLMRACLAYGYAYVAPASWGDELIAGAVVKELGSRASGTFLLEHCPFVAETLRHVDGAHAERLRLVSPPCAVARYLRAAFTPRELWITYVGRCPGALPPDIDERLLPELLLAQLLDAGVEPARQPDYFDTILPPDRGRFSSQPGGAPDPGHLMRRAGAWLHDVAPATLETVLRSCDAASKCVVDLAQASGCVCAQSRALLAQLEPPRANSDIVNTAIRVDVAAPVAKEPSPLAAEHKDSIERYWVAVDTSYQWSTTDVGVGDARGGTYWAQVDIVEEAVTISTRDTPGASGEPPTEAEGGVGEGAGEQSAAPDHDPSPADHDSPIADPESPPRPVDADEGAHSERRIVQSMTPPESLGDLDAYPTLDTREDNPESDGPRDGNDLNAALPPGEDAHLGAIRVDPLPVATGNGAGRHVGSNGSRLTRNLLTLAALGIGIAAFGYIAQRVLGPPRPLRDAGSGARGPIPAAGEVVEVQASPTAQEDSVGDSGRSTRVDSGRKGNGVPSEVPSDSGKTQRGR